MAHFRKNRCHGSAMRRLDEDKTIALIVHMQAASDDFFFIFFTMMEKKRRF